MAVERIVDEDGLPPKGGKRRPLRIAVEPSYVPGPQPLVGVSVGGRPL